MDLYKLGRLNEIQKMKDFTVWLPEGQLKEEILFRLNAREEKIKNQNSFIYYVSTALTVLVLINLFALLIYLISEAV